MTRHLLLAGCAAAILATQSEPAAAATFQFAYTTTAGVIGGTFEGTAIDANTVEIDMLLSLTFAGAEPMGFTPNIVDTPGDVLGFTSGSTPTVTFDGSLVELAVCQTPLCQAGFLLDSEGSLFAVPLYVAGSSFGGSAGNFVATDWSLIELPTAVPLEATHGYLAAAFGLMGLVATRRNRAR